AARARRGRPGRGLSPSVGPRPGRHCGRMGPMVRRAAIAAPNSHATTAAEHALSEGGSAVDAAIAAMLCATITEPGIVAPLGGCYLNVWPVDGDPVVIDGNVEMPG